MDALSIVQDEVALEGLDGITIPSLWIRLENRNPAFPLKLDSYTKGFIWRSLIGNSDLKFYELPQEREDVDLFDRFADIDPETGIQTAERFSDTKKDVYPVQVIIEDKKGIQGSCVFYKERRDVTKNVRTQALTELVNLEEAFKRYGRKLVVVASQMLRFRALIGMETDPELKLSDHSYCILERLGRSRWQGELQRDLHACSFKTDAGKLHYMRRSLDRHGLITMQSHVIRLPTGQQQHSVLLLLKRFHVNRRSKYDILMESMSNLLQEAPGQLASTITLREQLNVSERTFRRVYQYMQSAKLVQLTNQPLEDLNPSAGPCTTKRGTKILVRCLKLIKPYAQKEALDDDNDDEYGTALSRKLAPSEGRIMEREFVLQAYHIIISSGTRGISQSALRLRMNIGKLEARMICRKLERDCMIKGFMEDVGRQRITKFISHSCVGVSDHLQQFAKEQERNKLLCSSATPKTPKTAPRNSKSSSATPKTPSASRSKAKESTKKPVAKKTHKPDGERDEGGKEAGQTCSDGDQGEGDEGLDGGKGKTKRKPGRPKKKAGTRGRAASLSKQTKTPITTSTPVKCEASSHAKSRTSKRSTSCTATEQPSGQEEEETVLSPGNAVDQSEALNTASDSAENSITVVEDIPKQKAVCVRSKKTIQKSSLVERPHETYRLLRRKNLIVEAVHSLKVIEGLYTLQKMINEEEKQDGVRTKCCKKSILRLISSLSREGMLKLYSTTVIQDGISKKVEMVVHPSIQPNDEMVRRAIDQVRFRLSSSYSVVRLQHAQEKAKEQGNEPAGKNASNAKDQKSKGNKKRADSEEYEEFNPTPVKGLSRSLGFQPKMHRLRVIHNFLWYLIYGHPLQQSSAGVAPASNRPPTDAGASDPGAAPENPERSGADSDARDSDGQTRATEVVAQGGCAGDRQATQSAAKENSEVTSSGDDEEESMDASQLSHFPSDQKVFVEEESWKRFLPPVRVHKEFGHGWALVSDLLLCLPLSLFIQVIQINYKIDGLEEYLDDPVKQHYLVRVLPSKMKRQLLYKRKYIFTFHENMQKLTYMGLLQFGPVEKFKDKDQVFVYLKRHATIMDTTSAEPHYWQVTESPDKPFERRQYTFANAEDVENYWFDLLCVCLNTPLGVIRSKRGGREEEEPAPPLLPERSKFLKLAELLKGSREPLDDGSMPGDGKGAGGLDSEFFAHLKRNWLWTNHLLMVKKDPIDGELGCSKNRLRSLLSKNALRIALKAGGSTSPRCVTTKRPLVTEETIELGVEPASRNQQVAGGKRQKRKRNKKEMVKVPRKKRKEPKKRTPAHDEADHRALKRMTRQRVFWSPQEDSLMLLCSVASQLLNSKVKRPFVAHCVVRDLLQAEFEKSMDKTSLAVGRRTRYILKNPQTLLNYRICLAEVYQDKALLKQLELKKPANPEKPEDCAEAFSEYTRLLRQKFSSTMTSCDIVIPSSKHQLFSRYKVYTIDDGQEMSFKDNLTCTEDIHALVLNNLIQSTLVMSNSQMKTSRSFQTFHMYSKYNQEVLCQAFIDCRKKGLVNRRRVSKSYGPKKNRALPILPMSYQLSQIYYRCFAWRFPYTLCTDAFRFIRTLTDNGTADDRPLTGFYHETEGRTADRERGAERRAESEDASRSGKEEEGRGRGAERQEDENRANEQGGDKQGGDEQGGDEQGGDEQGGDKPTDKPEGQTEEGRKDETKGGENGQDGDEGDNMEVEQNGEKTEAVSETPESSRQLNPADSFTVNNGDEPSSGQQAEDPLPQEEQSGTGPASSPAPEASQEPEYLSEMLRFPLDSPGGACVACLSLMTLGLLSVHVSIPKQMVVVDSNLVDNEVVKSITALEEDEDDEDEAEESEGKKKLEVKAHQASHTNYLMMRGYCYPGIVKLRNLKTNDNIVVECCILRLQLRNTPAHQLFHGEDSPPLDLTKCGPSLLPPFLSHSILFPSSSLSPGSLEQCDARLIHQRGYSPQDIEACAELRRSLDEAGENGLALPDLYRAHRHLAEPGSGHTRSLQQYMQELQEEGQVLQVGGLGVRWVLMHHAEPWLLTSSSNPMSQPRLTQDGLFPLWDKQHNIPFIRKRCREVQEEEDEPDAKKAAGAREAEEEEAEGEGSSGGPADVERDNGGELEERREAGDGKGRGGLLNPEEEEAGKQTLPEEEREREAAQDSSDIRGKWDGQEEGEEQKDKEDKIQNERDDDSRSPAPSATPADADNEGDLSFVSRPWRMVDGSLNQPACKGMLEGILYHIMSRPGVTQPTLVEHYKDALQPTAVLDLTQALIEMGCVKKRTVVRAKSSLFSRSAGRTGGEAGAKEEDGHTVFYEPTISCCLRLAQVLPNEPHWNHFIQ